MHKKFDCKKECRLLLTLIDLSFIDLKCQDRSCVPSIREEERPPWIHSRKPFGEDQTSSSDKTFLVASEKWKGKEHFHSWHLSWTFLRSLLV